MPLYQAAGVEDYELVLYQGCFNLTGRLLRSAVWLLVSFGSESLWNKKATSTLQKKSPSIARLNCCTGLFCSTLTHQGIYTLAAARRRLNKSGRLTRYLGVLNTKACVWLADSVRNNPPSRFQKKRKKKTSTASLQKRLHLVRSNSNYFRFNYVIYNKILSAWMTLNIYYKNIFLVLLI